MKSMIQVLEANKEKIRDYTIIGYPILVVVTFFSASKALSTLCFCCGVIAISVFILFAVGRIKNQDQSLPIQDIIMFLGILVFFLPLGSVMPRNYAAYVNLGIIIPLFVSGFYLKSRFEGDIPSERMREGYLLSFVVIFFILGSVVQMNLEKTNLDGLNGELGEFYVLLSKIETGEFKEYPALLYVDNDNIGMSHQEEGAYGGSISHMDEIMLIKLEELAIGTRKLRFNFCNLSLYKTAKCRDISGQEWYIRATDKMVNE